MTASEAWRAAAAARLLPPASRWAPPLETAVRPMSAVAVRLALSGRRVAATAPHPFTTELRGALTVARRAHRELGQRPRILLALRARKRRANQPSMNRAVAR